MNPITNFDSLEQKMIAAIIKEATDKGFKDGFAQGRKEGFLTGFKKGIAQGRK